jgi:hypothetical protein
VSNVSRKALEAGTSRLLAASLDRAIAEVLPARLAFYEHWLQPEVLLRGGLGRAPLSAVLGFLRTERAYGEVVGRGGQLAAEWATTGSRRLKVCLLSWLPIHWAMRMGLGVARRVIRETSRTGRPLVRVERDAATIELDGSVFCDVREPAAHALCGYYASLTAQVLSRCGLVVDVCPTACRATGAAVCILAVRLTERRPAEPVAGQ